MPGGRELVVASLGFAPLLATLLVYGRRRVVGDAGRTPWLRRAVVLLLGVVHIVLAPLLTLGTWEIVSQAARATERVSRQMRDAAYGARRVVLLTGSDPSVWIYALRLARSERPGPIEDGCWWLVSAAKGEHRIRQIDPRSFSVETIGTTFLSEEAVRMYRAHDLPMRVGEEIVQCGAVVRIAATRDGWPSRLDIRLDMELDDPDLALLAWRHGAIERVSAGEITPELSLPWTPGPMGMF